MRTTLNVPFAEKDEARMLGAQWDRARRVWFVENVENLSPFMRWMNVGQLRPTEAPKKFAGQLDDEFRSGKRAACGLKWEVGTRVVVVWDQKWRPLDVVAVDDVRRDGGCKLSNGWVADKDGFLAGTRSRPGGRIGGLAP